MQPSTSAKGHTSCDRLLPIVSHSPQLSCERYYKPNERCKQDKQYSGHDGVEELIVCEEVEDVQVMQAILRLWILLASL